MCVVISHDSTRAVTSSWDGTIIIWDVAEGSVLHEWPAHRGSPAKALALSPDSRRLVSSRGHALAVWGIDSDPVLKAAELEGHAGEVNVCTWSPDGALIASASRDGTVRIWDGHTYEKRDLVSVPHPHSEVHTAECLQFSPDSSYIAWISGSTDCCIWQPLTGEKPKTLPLHPNGSHIDTTAFSFDLESRRIATAHGNKNNDPDACVIRIWDAATGTPIAVLAGHSKTVQNVSFSPDGRDLLSMADDNSMWIWDCGTWSGKQTGGFGDSESPVWYRQWCARPDGKYVATESYEGLVQLWRTRDGECVTTLDESGYVASRIEFSLNGEFLVWGDGKGIVYFRCISQFVGE